MQPQICTDKRKSELKLVNRCFQNSCKTNRSGSQSVPPRGSGWVRNFSLCPEVLEFLGLPPGYRFLLAIDYVDVWYDPSLLNV